MKTNNFKNLRSYNIDWLKNASANKTGAQQMLINSKPDHHMAIQSYTTKNGHIYADVDPKAFILASKYNFNLMEIITDNYHTIYFDIDAKANTITDKAHFRALVISELEKVFPNADWAISCSENDVKYSYHIIGNNYIIRNEDDKQMLKLIGKKLKETITDIDITVYSKNR